jgi:hypothetical protein
MFALAVACAAQPGVGHAALIVDPTGDFLPTYTGPQNAGLDVIADEVSFTADRLNFFGRMAGPVAPTQAIGGVYLFGLDRGQGTARFNNAPAAPPVIGPNVLFDSVLRINPDGTGQFVNIVAGGPPTALNPVDITISGNEIAASIPLSVFLPAATRPIEQWTYNLWPRNGTGLNVQVSDLAPDNSNSPVVPESSLGVLGATLVMLLTVRRSTHRGNSTARDNTDRNYPDVG